MNQASEEILSVILELSNPDPSQIHSQLPVLHRDNERKGHPALDSSTKITQSFQSPPDLPIELWVAIFELLRPHHTSFELDRYGDLQEFCTNQLCHYSFAQICLVCTAWNQITTPMLYEYVVMEPYRQDHLAQLTFAFASRGCMVKNILVRGSHPKRFAADLVGKCLALCTDLRILNCDKTHNTFSARNWLQNTCPNLPKTLKYFKADRITGQMPLPRALFGLVGTLEGLSIQNWHPGPIETLHLPAKIPHLSSIVFENVTIELHHIHKLLSRIKTKSEHAQSDTVPLRHLTLRSVTGLRAPDLIPILQINGLCRRLTTLRFHPGFVLTVSNDPNLELPILILSLCPSLVDFSYTGPTTPQVWQHISPRLEQLELLVCHCGILHTSILTTADQLVQLLKQSKPSSLVQLTIRKPSYRLAFDELPLRVACETLGIVLKVWY